MSALSTSANCPAPPLVPTLVPNDVAILADEGINITQLNPLGAEVNGMDVTNPPSEVARKALERSMALRGFIAIKGVGVLAPEEQISASCLFGGVS